MADEHTDSNIEIIYIDPNKDIAFYGEKSGGFDLMIPPEELSIYIRLRVHPLSHRSFVDGNYEIFEVVSDMVPQQSIPSGTDYSTEYNPATVRVLTTDYLNYGWQAATDSNMKHGQPESLGISSINITYSSWFTPIVVIKFVDIMGMSLMNPSQSGQDGNAVYSLFRSFYIMPYPLYTLTIKGFYGEAITYELHCETVETTINTNTGNTEITVKFLSYVFSKYNSINMSWLMGVPYITEPDNIMKIWEDRGYRYTTGSKGLIKPYLSMLEIINSTLDNVKKISETTSESKINNEYQTLKNILLQIKENVDIVLDETKKLAVNESITPTLIPNIPIKIYFPMVAPQPDVMSLITPKLEVLYNVTIQYNEELAKITEENKKDLSLFGKEIPKTYEGIEVYLSYIIKKYAQNMKSIDEKIENADTTIINNQYEEYKSILDKLPFEPTMKNMLEWLFTHYVIFEEAFFRVRDSQEGIELRKNISEKNQIKKLEPWFVLRTDTGDGWMRLAPNSEKVIDKIDISISNRLPEVQFSNSFFQSILTIDKFFDNTKNADGDVTTSKPIVLWLPIFAYDISNQILPTARHDDNPYKRVISGNNIGTDIMNIGIQIILRMFASMGRRFIITVNKPSPNDGEAEKYAKADAENLYNAIKNEVKICDRIKDALKSNEFKNYLFTLINHDQTDVWNDVSYEKTYLGFNNNNIPNIGIGWDPGRNQWYHIIYTLFSEEQFTNIINRTYTAILPLFSMTWVEMDSGNGIKNKDEIPQLLTSQNDMQTIYNNVSLNMYKSSFNIVDVSENVFDNLEALYDELSVSNSDLITKWYFVKDSGYNEKIRKLYYNDAADKYIINIGEPKVTPSFKISDLYLKIEDYKKTWGKSETNTEQIKSDTLQNTLFKENISIISGNRNKGDDNFYTIEEINKEYKTLPQTTLDLYITEIRSLALESFDSFDSCIAIPSIKKQTSIFANPFYYECNKIEEDYAIFYKAYLLLTSMGIEKLDSYLEEYLFTCQVMKLQKYVCLTIGSIIYISNNSEIYNKHKNLLKPDIKNTMKLRYDMEKVFSNYFENWAKSNEVRDIITELEYSNCNNAGEFSLKYDYYNKDSNAVFPKSKFKNLDAYNMGVQVQGRGRILRKDNEHNMNFKQLFLNPKNNSVKKLMQLYRDDVLIFNSRCNNNNAYDRDNVNKSNISMYREDVKKYVDTISNELNKHLNGLSTENYIKPTDSNAIMTDENKKELIYYSFKELHDRWYAAYETPTSKKLEEIMSGVHIIDKYYSNIGDRLFVDLKKVGDMLKSAFNDNWTLYGFISELCKEHGCFMFSQPSMEIFKSGNYMTETSFMEYLFKPKTITQCNKSFTNPGLFIMLIEEPSTTPTDLEKIHDETFEDDTLHIGKVGKMVHLNHATPITCAEQIGPIRAFGVSFGKQNQSFFKVANLTNNKPQVTEQTAKAILNILEKGRKDGVSGQYVGNDLYDIYSKYSYMCTINMPGCAPISPLMYFQLNNVYLFTGAYMIFKMTHSITPGKMETSFTGIKQTIYKKELIKDPMISIITSIKSSIPQKTGGKSSYVGVRDSIDRSGDRKVATKEGINEWFVKPNCYFAETTEKKRICLHHTVSGYKWTGIWETFYDKSISTTYYIQGDGMIYKLIPENYWGWHLGANGGGLKMNKETIGIELAAWGILHKDGDTYHNWERTAKIAAKDVEVLNQPFRGSCYYMMYPKAQIDALESLLRSLHKTHNIPLLWLGGGHEIIKPESFEKCDYSKPGIYSHTSFRSDKSDVYPSTLLIAMLEKLQKTVGVGKG